MNKRMIWAEMARRKVRFYNNEQWDKINLWGLFCPSDILPQIKRKELIPYGEMPIRRTGWFKPSKEAWENEIKPMIDKHSLDELTSIAGW